MPETEKDVKTKIEYLKILKELSINCKNAEEFKVSVKNKFPGYYGEKYLDMTAEFFFPVK